MEYAVSIVAVVGWFVPFFIEIVCRKTRPAHDGIARAAIGSIAAYLFLIHCIALIDLSSRFFFIGAAWVVALVWLLIRIPVLKKELVHGSLRTIGFGGVASALIVGGVAIIFLVQPHFSYTGYRIDSDDVTEVVNEKNLTPFFSDEWASVAFVDQALTTKGLPTQHPFNERSKYVSYLTPYFMGLAAFFSTFGLDPVYEFAYAPITLSLALVYAAYFAARSLTASRVASTIAALTVLFITNSSNLAGIWYAIPAHAGLLILTLTIALKQQSKYWRVLGFFLSVVLYPPGIVFALPIIIFSEPAIRRYTMIGALMSSVCVVVLGSLSENVSLVYSFRAMADLVVRPLGLDFAGDIVLYPPHMVIPFAAIAGCIAATPLLFSKYRLIGSCITIGIVGWVAYSFIDTTIFIDVQRVVFITAYFVCVAAAVGYDCILEWFKNTIGFDAKPVAWAALFLVIAHSIPLYTQDTSWRRLILPTPKRGEGTFLLPSPPATQYLVQDDIDILARFDVFPSSSPRTFISMPWKGLTLGAATRHIPLHTKASIFGSSRLRYEEFIQADCTTIEEYRIKYSIDFAYLPQLPSCPNMIPVATSTEGFVLYEMRSL